MLIIGSGKDLDGRGMGERIDNGEWDIVVRVNKHYGAIEDVGSRTDVIITRWASWLDNHEWFPQDEQDAAKEVIILNQNLGFSQSEYWWLVQQVGHNAVSAGCQALAWALYRGAASIDVIGYGYRDGGPKTYTNGSTGTTPTSSVQVVDNKTVDMNDHYDWSKEDAWADRQPKLRFLPHPSRLPITSS